MHYIGWFSRSMTCGARKNHTGKPMEPDLMAGWLSRTYGQGMKTTLERSAGSADSTGYAGSAGSVGSAGAADFVGPLALLAPLAPPAPRAALDPPPPLARPIKCMACTKKLYEHSNIKTGWSSRLPKDSECTCMISIIKMHYTGWFSLHVW